MTKYVLSWLLVSLHNSDMPLVHKSMHMFGKSLQKDSQLKHQQDVITQGDPTCDKGVTELQEITKLSLSSFAESHWRQQQNFDTSLTLDIK